MSKKVMKLLDRSTGLMECRVCGRRHTANLQGRPGKFPIYQRGSWQCLNRCRLEDLNKIAEKEKKDSEAK